MSSWGPFQLQPFSDSVMGWHCTPLLVISSSSFRSAVAISAATGCWLLQLHEAASEMCLLPLRFDSAKLEWWRVLGFLPCWLWIPAALILWSVFWEEFWFVLVWCFGFFFVQKQIGFHHYLQSRQPLPFHKSFLWWSVKLRYSATAFS